MAKRQITEQQKSDIRTLTRMANRRIERASEGQRRAIEHYNKGNLNEKGFFSSSYKGLSYAEANKKIKALKNFEKAESTMRRGWERIKSEQIKKTTQTWRERNYDLTEEEIEAILKAVDESEDESEDELANRVIQDKERRKRKYYVAVDLVQAAKEEKGWKGSEEDITRAIAPALDESADAQAALINSIKARNAKR